LTFAISTALPGGFKAQLAATSRRAAVRYREQLLVAFREAQITLVGVTAQLVDALGHRVGGHGALIRWYRSRGNAWLKPRVTEWAQRLRVKTTAFEVAELGYRWGTTEPSGRVRINWTTMQLRPALVEYVIAHELAHLKEAHHGPAFWELLARVQPDYVERRTELARTGAKVWLGIMDHANGLSN
jgi:predicted metal-dependent hydrolase